MTDAHEPRPGGEIVVYDAPDGEVTLNVRLEQETVWLTRERMAAVFASTTENVRQHLRNVFVDGELEESATTEDFLVVRSERCRWVRAHRGSAAASPTVRQSLGKPRWFGQPVQILHWFRAAAGLPKN